MIPFIFYLLRLSQNFSFWESSLRFRGKNGLLTLFSKAFPETNRVLGKALSYPRLFMGDAQFPAPARWGSAADEPVLRGAYLLL
jgi:hypothetical protein